MDQRDWELLDKQIRRSAPPRNDGIVVLTIAAVFFAGLIIGGIFFGQESGSKSVGTVASYLPIGSAPITSR